MTDLLKKAAKTAKRTEPAAKKDERTVLALSKEEQDKCAKLIELAALHGEIDPLVNQHKKSVGEMLFGHWVQTMWEKKQQPDNPRVILMKKDDKGNETALGDCKLLLQIKFRSTGLANVLPSVEDLPDGKSAAEVLIDTLVSDAVGLEETNAKKFVNDEVTITDRVTLAKSLDAWYYSTDPLEQSIGTKLLTFITTFMPSETPSDEPKKKRTKKPEPLAMLTEEEAGKVLVTQQVVTMKEGLFQRIHTYCRSVDELKKLINFIKSTVQVSNFEFGISDEVPVRVKRMTEAIQHYLMPQPVAAK